MVLGNLRLLQATFLTIEEDKYALKFAILKKPSLAVINGNSGQSQIRVTGMACTVGPTSWRKDNHLARESLSRMMVSILTLKPTRTHSNKDRSQTRIKNRSLSDLVSNSDIYH
jgi:hypothetical protein